MVTRRWTDPRNRRRWEVSAGRVRRSGSAPGRDEGPRVLSFHHLATPRQDLRVDCCDRAEESLGKLGDQHLALCLDAARTGGFLWVDPRDREIWWIRSDVDGSGEPRIHLRSARGDHRVSGTVGAEPAELTEEEILTLVDGLTAV